MEDFPPNLVVNHMPACALMDPEIDVSACRSRNGAHPQPNPLSWHQQWRLVFNAEDDTIHG